jgi:hypothetical protein
MKAWRRYWQWYGIGYGMFQAGVAVTIVVSGALLIAIPVTWLAFGPDLGVGFPWY